MALQVTDDNIEDLIAASDYLGVGSLKNDCCEVSCQARWWLLVTFLPAQLQGLREIFDGQLRHAVLASANHVGNMLSRPCHGTAVQLLGACRAQCKCFLSLPGLAGCFKVVLNLLEVADAIHLAEIRRHYAVRA